MNCTSCGETAPEQFYKESNGRTRSRCKKCYYEAQQERKKISQPVKRLYTMEVEVERG